MLLLLGAVAGRTWYVRDQEHIRLTFECEAIFVRVSLPVGGSVALQPMRARIIGIDQNRCTDVSKARVRWTSSAPAVAEVTADGQVRGRAPGSAEVTATQGSRTALARVTVLPATTHR